MPDRSLDEGTGTGSVGEVPAAKKQTGRRFIPSERDRYIAKAIVSGRERLTLNQQDLATRAGGFSGRSLKRYENVQRAIPENVLARIEAVIGSCRPESQTTATGSTGVSEGPAKVSSAADSTATTAGGYSTMTPEGTIVAKAIDGLDDEARTDAMLVMMNALRDHLHHPHELGADKRPDRARRNKS